MSKLQSTPMLLFVPPSTTPPALHFPFSVFRWWVAHTCLILCLLHYYHICLRLPSTLSNPRRTQRIARMLWSTQQQMLILEEVKCCNVESFPRPVSWVILESSLTRLGRSTVVDQTNIYLYSYSESILTWSRLSLACRDKDTHLVSRLHLVLDPYTESVRSALEKTLYYRQVTFRIDAVQVELVLALGRNLQLASPYQGTYILGSSAVSRWYIIPKLSAA